MLKILMAGDFCPKAYMTKEVLQNVYIQNSAKTIAEHTAKHDISVINVETVYSDCDIPISKTGPNIKSSMESLDFLRAMNFTVAACANNHIGDYGEQGVLDTLAHLRKLGFVTVGAGKNAQDAAKICYLERNGMTVALINQCEHEYGTAKKNRAGAAELDFYDTGKQIREAKEKADAVIVYLHGGNETNPLPRPGMKKLCRHLAECGASAVIVTHAHCPQGIEVHHDVPIAYGMGNFYFYRDKPEGMWGKGYMVSLKLDKNGKAMMELLPYKQHHETGIQLLEGVEKQEFMQYVDCISDLMLQEEIYEKLTLAWCRRGGTAIWDLDFCGTPGERNGLMTLGIRNRYTCESHNELMRTYLEAYCDGRIDESLEPYEEMLCILQQGEIVDLMRKR